MHAASASIVEASGSTTPNFSMDWLRWCRLCAKDDVQNINILFKDEEEVAAADNVEKKDLILAIAIGKFFCVQINEEEQLPKRLCSECFSLVTSLINFNERVAKVQQMYVSMQKVSDFTNIDFQDLRLRYEVLGDDRPHDIIYRTLAETHIFEAKSKISDNIGVDADIEIMPQDNQLGIGIKKETSTDITTATDEDAYDFDNEEAEGEDPFGSDIEFSNDCEKLCCFEEKSFKSAKNNNIKSSSIICQKENVQSETVAVEFQNKTGNPTSNESVKTVLEKSETETETVDSVSKEKVQIYTCSECSHNFKRLSNYRSHMERKHAKSAPVPRFFCSECNLSFNTQTQLSHHTLKHLPLTKRRVVPCSYCEQKFPTKTYVAQHIKYVHMNERSFICEECGEAVRSKGQLKQHMLIHTDFTPFECEVCKKGFKNQVRLKNHMETHNPNKHICAECGLQLNSRATLNRHLLVHSDVMQHKCDYCGRAFKRAKALKNHLILHTGLKPYSCDFCDRTFANGSNCRTHKRKAHPEELAALEASGEKTYTKNIPKLAVLKSVTRVAENLAPVVSKQSGNFAFGKKPKLPPDGIGTVSSKQTKIRKESVTPMMGSNEMVDKSNNIAGGHSILSDKQSNVHHTNGENKTSDTNIPPIDNIYSHLMKQTINNSGYDIAPAITINPMHADIKRTRSKDTSPASNNCVGIDIPNTIAQNQHPLSQHIHLPPQQPAIASTVQSFCTQFMKQHKIIVEEHQQHDEISVHSADSHASHLTEDNSIASATARKVNNFYNHMSQNTTDKFL